MNRKHAITVLQMVMVAAVLCLFAACSSTRTDVYVGDDSRHDDVYVGKGPGPGHGPPPHAPAHGFRKKRTYYYYPDTHVYFDIGRKVYFYAEEERWRMSASLPGHLHVELGDYVTIQIDSDKPYLYSKLHKKRYPPKHWKHHKKVPPGHKKKW